MPAAGAAAAPAPRILVWDAAVRVSHGLMVLCFAGAWLTAESERWRLVHVTLGWTMAGLVVFRLLWGLVGSRHARFSSFVRGPAAALRYLRSLAGPAPEHHVGHNPAGALAILGLLALAAGVCLTGWLADGPLPLHAVEELHEGIAVALAALVGLHVAAVVVSSRLHRENLAAAMITGRKRGAPNQATGRAWRSVAALLLAAVLGFWAWQWSTAPASATADGRPAAGASHDDDD